MTENLQDRQRRGRAVILGPFVKSLQRSGWLLSFFDDGEETAPRPSARRRAAAARAGARAAPAAAPPPRPGGPGGVDQHTLMVRRRVAAGRRRRAADRDRAGHQRLPEKPKAAGAEGLQPRRSARSRSESDAQVVQAAVHGARRAPRASRRSTSRCRSTSCASQAQKLASRAKGLSVPGEMTGAQRNLLLTLQPPRRRDRRRSPRCCPTALGGQGKQASTQIAGDMEIFLASDVLYSQRVAPLIQQTLAATRDPRPRAPPPTRFLPNLGWLEPSTVEARLTGQQLDRPEHADGHAAPTAARCGRERRHEHARSRTDAQPHQRRRQPDVHGDRRKLRRIPARRTSRSTSR